MNDLIHLAKQMGLIHKSYNNIVPNATKCYNMGDVLRSHEEKDHTVIVQVNDIYGMLVLLGLGVCGALITFTAETVVLLIKRRGRRKSLATNEP